MSIVTASVHKQKTKATRSNAFFIRSVKDGADVCAAGSGLYENNKNTNGGIWHTKAIHCAKLLGSSLN